MYKTVITYYQLHHDMMKHVVLPIISIALSSECSYLKIGFCNEMYGYPIFKWVTVILQYS